MSVNVQNTRNNQSNSVISSRFLGFGIVLILLGFIFLASQFGIFSSQNWWALFILIPAFGAFGSAYAIWKNVGSFNFWGWSAFYGGLFPLMVALIFMFDLEWSIYWPLFVILAGFGLLMISGLAFMRLENASIVPALLCHRPWGIFIGLSAVILGLRFLGADMGIVENLIFLEIQNWWGIYILIPALGGLVTALLLLIGGHSVVLMLINLALSAIITLSGMIALLDLDWKLMISAGSMILILVGLGLIFGIKKDQD